MVDHHYSIHIILILFYHYLKIVFVKEFFHLQVNVKENLSFMHPYLILVLLMIFKMNQLEKLFQVFVQV